MDKSESIAGIAEALAKAQAIMEKAAKDTTNPFFKSKYADLESVMGAIKPALKDNGLSFIQICHDAENAAKVETVILHSSGEWISCGIISVPVSRADAQAYGSALTYARRYSLSAAFGVAPEDDDGNAAGKKPEHHETKPEHKPETAHQEGTKYITEGQRKLLWAKMNEVGMPVEDFNGILSKHGALTIGGKLKADTLPIANMNATLKEITEWIPF